MRINSHLFSPIALNYHKNNTQLCLTSYIIVLFCLQVFISGQLSANAHESFRREVCIMNTLRHPNVVILLAASPSPPKLAIVMEYVGGGSLYYHLHVHKTPLPVDVIATLLADITRGLQYLHSINILHRDLKSKNVLLTAPPPLCHAKLCDFGLARMRLESATMTGEIGFHELNFHFRCFRHNYCVCPKVNLQLCV